jgi:hypothetical protein
MRPLRLGAGIPASAGIALSGRPGGRLASPAPSAMPKRIGGDRLSDMRRRRLDDRDDDLPTSVLLRYPFDMVRLACTRCGRRGQYRKSTLLARFGPDYGLVSR